MFVVSAFNEAGAFSCLHAIRYATMTVIHLHTPLCMDPKVTRPDTRLPQLRVGGQGPYLRSLDHLGRSREAKDHKNPKKVNCDGRYDRRTNGPTDGQTDGPTKRGVESRSTQPKMFKG